MYLRSVHLINWRSYRNARFEFPRPTGDRNVVLVMAPNEYGKTSFFEAVTLGLFGRDGLSLIPRARSAAAGSDARNRTNTTYSKFLKDALHRQAVEVGPPECVVKLEWEDESGDPIEIKRTWYFGSNGLHKVADDQLQIYDGVNRTPIGPPETAENKDHWYREWIFQRFVQPNLAEFFLFDGEQVQRYASRDMSHQVRLGIEGMLGLPVLHGLKESLEKYAQNRRTQAAPPADETVNEVKQEIERLENRIAAKATERDEVNACLPNIEAEIDELTQRLRGRSEGTVALVANLLDDEQRYRDEAQRKIAALADLIAGDMALAIAGTSLNDETIKRLGSEAKRETWEAGKNEGNRNLDRYISDFSQQLDQLELPIDAGHRNAIIEAAKAAWDALWHPPPDGCAETYLHASLTGTTRAGAIARLEEVGRHSATEVSGHVADFNRARTTADAKKRERLELEQVQPEVEAQTEQFKQLVEQAGRYKQQRDDAQREIRAATAKLDDKRAELGRYVSRLDTGSPILAYTALADDYAKLVEHLIKSTLPHQISRVAEEMTRAWKSMAHMADRVKRIEISPDCKVKMLAADGTDLHEIEKSAGASQVFTQALIVAITRVSGRSFPFVVDTPLARLSREQRLGVLKTFTDRSGQVILLSTDQEVVDDKLDAIRQRIVASYELKVDPDRGIPVTTVHELDVENIRS